MYSPLLPNEQAKVILFSLLLVPLIGAGGLGILLILITLWGVYMMKKSKDFQYIETISKLHKYCAILVSLGSFIFIIGLLIYSRHSGGEEYAFIIIVSMSFASFLYMFLYKTLFYIPLSNHKDWIIANGIFATSEKEDKPSTSILKRDKVSSYSVAGELQKWVKLKEEGHISQEEFDKIRKDLLG